MLLSSSTAPTAPRMFQITAVTTNSLSFSWQAPTNPNGNIASYEICCQPLLLDIPTPELLISGPTNRMTVLPNLNSGVRYNCSIGARNSAALSELVYADNTTMEIGRFMYYCGFISQLYEENPPCSLPSTVIMKDFLVDTAMVAPQNDSKKSLND